MAHFIQLSMRGVMFVPGQVILYTNGPNIISKAIRLIEGNEITHCSIVLIADDVNPICLEIENASSKVRLVQLLDTLHYSDEIFIATNPTLTIPESLPNSPQVISYLINKKYSIKALINSLINHLLGFLKPSHKYKEYLTVTNKYTCSSLVAEVLTLISKYKCNIPSLVEPDDFTQAPWILTKYK
jgi:hypothetical protein